MPRRPRFSDAQILDATATLVADGGLGAATIGAIGAVLDAPSGSIYHRFPTRDVLLGRLWLRKASFFQDRFVAGPRRSMDRRPGSSTLASRIGASGLRRRPGH